MEGGLSPFQGSLSASISPFIPLDFFMPLAHTGGMKKTLNIPVHQVSNNIPPPRPIADAGEQTAAGFGGAAADTRAAVGSAGSLFPESVDLGAAGLAANLVDAEAVQQPVAQVQAPSQPQLQQAAMAVPAPSVTPPATIDVTPLITRLTDIEVNAAKFQAEVAKAFGSVRKEFDAQVKPTEQKPVDLTDIYVSLDNINAGLNKLAQASGVTLSPPVIKLRQHRHMNYPAKVEGGFVVLHYSPRPDEPVEIQLRLEPRMVNVGYSFEIPSGHVADVWSAGRCVASFAGSSGEHEARLPVIGSSNMGQVMSSGREILRLSLRRIEPIEMVVEKLTV